MTKCRFGIILLALCPMVLFSCADTSRTDEESGTVRIALAADAGFATRSVDEGSYTNVDNYRVQVLDSSNEVQCDYLFSDIPTSIRLQNGSYRLVASYGEDSAASRNGFRVEGATDFNVEGTDQTISVSCSPLCGKVAVKFDPSMQTYFSDYSVEYETKALKTAGTFALWAKGDSDPWYLKLDESGERVKATIKVTRKSDSKATSLERTYDLERNKAWTLNIAPKNEDGGLGLSITVDESTDDKTVDIVVPADWI